MARAQGRSLAISFKQSIEVCNYIRGKSVETAKKILEDAFNKKKAIPFKRFNRDTGHKKWFAAGRYPVKTAKEIFKLIEACEANAQYKGLNTSSLVISHICAHKGGKAWHYGRKRARKMKRTSIEIVLEEKMKKKVDSKRGEVKKEKKPVELKESPEKPKVEKKATEKEIKTKVPETQMKKEEKKEDDAPKQEIKKESTDDKPKESEKQVKEEKNKETEKVKDTMAEEPKKAEEEKPEPKEKKDTVPPKKEEEKKEDKK